MKKVLTIGEILMRLSTPPGTRLSTAKQLDVNYGGAEANTAISLSIYGHETVYVTRLPDNALTLGITRYLKGLGVDTSFIQTGGERVGSYYLDVGVGQRGSQVIYDRKHSSFSEMTTDMVDIDALLIGVDLIHMTGITPALSTQLKELVLAVLEKAKKQNITISFDFNYRAALWTKEEAGHFFKQVLPYVTLASLSAWDMVELLGYAPFKDTLNHQELLETAYETLKADYPNIQAIYATKRESPSANRNTLTGFYYTDQTLYTSETYTIDPIVDRVGGGDAFAAGVLNGFLKNFDPDQLIAFATQASVLKHYIAGDANLVTESDVFDVMEHGAQIKR